MGKLGGLDWLTRDPDLRVVVRVLKYMLFIGAAGLTFPLYQGYVGEPVSWLPALTTFGGLLLFSIVVSYLMNSSIERLLIWSGSKYKGLSIIGLFLRRRTIHTYFAAALVGLAAALYTLGLASVEGTQDRSVLGLLCGLLISIVMYQQVLEYRVRKGLFGSTNFEARAVLELLTRRSEDFDLHDDGKARKLLSSRDLDAFRQRVREVLAAAKDI